MTSVVINLSIVPGFNSLVNDCFSDESTNILKLNKAQCKIEETDNDQKYKLIGYDKNLLNENTISTYGLCRSVIVNSDNKVICFSPPKSIPYHKFIERERKNVIAQEFVEGTMVNVFWDEKNGLTGSWEISTKNTVGATSSFFKSTPSKTFRVMFTEALQYTNLDLDFLDKKYCYSFVLQHPENRIVVRFEQPMLYLVAVYKINNEDENNITVTVVDVNETNHYNLFTKTIVKLPAIYDYSDHSELIEKFASNETNYNILGFVLYDSDTGERSKVRNPAYEEVRRLRGNQPKPQYHYLCLRRENKVSKFLEYFPEYKSAFSQFRNQVHLFTNTLFSNYISCYVKKEKKLLEFSEKYRTHMFSIHQKYKNDLKELNLYVTKNFVINYVNELPPSLLMYCLNYHLRNNTYE